LAGYASVGSLASAYSRSAAALALGFTLAAHLGIGTIAGIQIGLRERTAAALWLAPVILAFHCAYGVGTLRGLLVPFPGPKAIPAQGSAQSSKDCV